MVPTNDLSPDRIEVAILNSGGSAPRRIFLAYSGGVDSHVLLYLCAQIPWIRARLIATHIHHGLQGGADAWATHAESIAVNLGVEFLLRRVDARPAVGESPEEAARNARYMAFTGLLETGDLLLLAQHRDDQLETVLLNCLRGGGVLGLAAMPVRLSLGAGTLIRPLLDVSKEAIDEYAAAHKLRWVEDPSNRDARFDRNYLRQKVIPLLKQRWPSCSLTVSRTAGHCADAHDLLTSMAGKWFAESYDERENSIAIENLMKLEAAARPWVIRHWFRLMQLKMPKQAFLTELFAHILDAGTSGNPLIMEQGKAFRRYRDKLYCIQAAEPIFCAPIDWPSPRNTLAVGDRLLCYVRADSGISEARFHGAQVTVKFRSGGEQIPLPGRRGRHSLKNLFQEIGMPPWERLGLPLIYLDGQLAAVADLWISADFFQEKSGQCIRFSLSRE